MSWTVILLSEVAEWFEGLDPRTAQGVAAALDLLEERGPALGRPLVDTLQGASLPNLKELRPGSAGASEVRLLFAFDPERQAIVLTAGDKAGQWQRWYQAHIPLAEDRYRRWLAGEYAEEETP
ncbi:type II toxin-antitoxin system RelE/ParE family toxin [Deinococcus yunweiensis]|uniref:type II toxin-antitoxin system RelE/ParE family toxin n=1 Tax=Deinococcus yunweiensis TaxID=367282 RepID=UPI00398F658B